ncbi:MAG: flagellar hook-associated protein FlgK [Nocardioidaceae bacterium]
MSGTLSSFNTALSALRYNQLVMDVASGNVANVGTEGYARRRVEAQSVGAPTQPAMWSRYADQGDGVRVSGLSRLVDPLIDARSRREHGLQSYLDVRQTVLDRVETGFGEPGDDGVAAAMVSFRNSWHDLANSPASTATRTAVLTAAKTLSEAVNAQARNITAEQGDQRQKLLDVVAEVNTVASDLAAANKAIANANMNGTDPNVLLDQRDQFALRLSELTGAVGTIRSDGGMDISVNGVSLVSGQNASTFQIAAGVTPTGAADGNPVSFQITGTAGTTAVTGGLKGEAGAVTDLLNVTLPAYLTGLGAVAQTLADTVNTQHAAGYDAAGTAGGALFSYNASDPASTLTVAITDPALLAASALTGGVVDGGNADALAGLTAVEGDYQRLVGTFGSEVASTRRLAANQATLTAQVDNSREELSGVNIDEEMVSMMTAQRAYEAASRVMTTLDSVLDTLINRTGVTR